MTERETVLIRIKKLLNMAEHANANEHESLVAAKQAESLMRKYNIDYAEAIAQEIKTGAGMATADCVATAKDNGTPTLRTPLWAQQIAVRLGELFDTPVRLCQVRTTVGSPNSISPEGYWEQGVRFHGYTHDVEVAAWTFNLLVSTVNRVCKTYRKHPHYLANGRTVMNAYRMGVVHSILVTIREMTAEKDATQTAPGTALVLVKRDAIAKQYGQFTYREAKAPTVRDADAYHSGRVEGRKIEVRTAITEGTAPKQVGT